MIEKIAKLREFCSDNFIDLLMLIAIVFFALWLAQYIE
jgi:hypothetical protein